MSPQSQFLPMCARGHLAEPSRDPRLWDPCGESTAVLLLTMLAFFLIAA
jgi:hypothetical protein